jgi:phospholipid N-methyltransferase
MHERIAMSKTLASYWRFLIAGLSKQGQTGAFVPSQRFLIDKMIAPVPSDYRGQILELGAGTGVLTRRLASQRPGARVLACEINPVLARDLEYNMASAGLSHRVHVLSDSAERVMTRLRANGARRPDFIISGIPLGNLHRRSVFALVEQIHDTLAPGGMYIQFQYTLIDRKKIKSTFARLRTGLAPLNVPPAFVYFATK